MTYYLKVDLPSLAGAEAMVEVPGLGAVINPGTYEVPEDRLAQFESLHGYPLSEAQFQEGIQLFEKDEESGELSEVFRTPEDTEEVTKDKEPKVAVPEQTTRNKAQNKKGDS